MKRPNRALMVLLIVFFPIGIIYCLLHTIGKDICCFLGIIFGIGLGILVGIWLANPNMIISWINWLRNLFGATPLPLK